MDLVSEEEVSGSSARNRRNIALKEIKFCLRKILGELGGGKEVKESSGLDIVIISSLCECP